MFIYKSYASKKMIQQDSRVKESASNIYQDVPQHQPGLTSSIGGLWPPQPASFQRIKGFYTPNIIRDEAELMYLVNQLQKYAERAFHDNPLLVTRVSLRGAINLETLITCREKIIPFLEAIISFQGTHEPFEETGIVYFSMNHPSRRSLDRELETYKGYLSSIFHVRVRPISGLMERLREGGYQISLFSDHADDETINQVFDLYRRFGWSRKEVVEILSQKNNLVGIASFEGKIISAGIAEFACIPIGKEQLRLAEITEAATAEEHMGKGVYTTVSSFLLSEIARKSRQKEILGGEIDCVFGECNGNALGVLKTAKIQGRTFSLDIGERYSFPESGILRQHVPISGAPRTTPYNDLFPAYLTRERLYQIQEGR